MTLFLGTVLSSELDGSIITLKSLGCYQNVNIPKALLSISTLYVLYRFLLFRFEKHRFDTFMEKHSYTKPASVRKTRTPLIILRLYTLFSFKGDVLDDLFYRALTLCSHRGWTMVVQNIEGEDLITTADPMIVKTILHSKFCDWEIGRTRHAAFEPFLGQGIFTTDGELWKQSRGILRPLFTRKNIEKMAEYASSHFNDLLQVIGKAGTDDDGWTNALDVHEYFLSYAMDVGMDFMFRKNLGSLSLVLSGDSKDSKSNKTVDETKLATFQKAFEDAHRGMTIRGRLGGFYWLYYSPRFYRASKICREYIDTYVEEGFSRKHLDRSHQVPYNLLDELRKTTNDKKLISATLLQMLLASRNTTGATLSFIVALLARHQYIFNHLREEILRIFGEEHSGIEISFTRLKTASYLQAVIHETLRLYPIIPYNIRTALRDTILPTGGGEDGSEPLAVRKGTRVGYIVYAMHRRPDLWGPDAKEWKPERWQGKQPGWEYLPFNAGPRVCMGQDFAMSQLGYALVRFFQRYKGIRLGEGSDPVLKKGVRLGIFPKEVFVQFQRAN